MAFLLFIFSGSLSLQLHFSKLYIFQGNIPNQDHSPLLSVAPALSIYYHVRTWVSCRGVTCLHLCKTTWRRGSVAPPAFWAGINFFRQGTMHVGSILLKAKLNITSPDLSGVIRSIGPKYCSWLLIMSQSAALISVNAKSLSMHSTAICESFFFYSNGEHTVELESC